MGRTVKYLIAVLVLFGAIALAGRMRQEPKEEPVVQAAVQEIDLGTTAAPKPVVQAPVAKVVEKEVEVDRIASLFALDGAALPIVETVSFTSRVPWMKDRPAWIADYASHYQTSRHFIARSLNRKADYFTQKVHPGDRFNVFRKDKNIRFHLVADLSKCRLWFYYLDKDDKVLLKTYKIGIGKPSGTTSGSLTPLGKFELGEKVAIYKPGIQGFFRDQKMEMIRVFGTRWLPVAKRLDGPEVALGLGLHGLPWMELNGALVEDRSKIGKADSDGCIRLAQEDIEEIFSIVITKPTTLEVVKEYKP